MKIFCYPNTNVLDAAVVKNRLRAKFPDGSGPWLYPAVETPNGSNDVRLQDDIVINEIMYHYGGSSYQPYVESSEEWLELYNRASTNISLDGWAFTEGIDYEFPPGTTIAPSGYLVVAKNTNALVVKYPAIDIVGNYGGQLADGGERILLVDDRGNPADEVTYHDSRPWPEYADGLGSSLELRHPDADNNSVGAWAASDEGLTSVWTNYTYTMVATNPVYDPNNTDLFPELRIGLLYEGEILIDNISVIEDPGGAARELMQNGTFNASSNFWRFMGTHEFSEVIPNPENPTNPCLRLLSSGPMSYLSNRGESTLKFGPSYVSVSAGTEYRISFDAKWIGGCPQFHTELYYTEVADTTALVMPSGLGTPGARNSRYENNVGPTFRNAIHAPAVPPAGQPATVSIRADDSDGIANLTLWYSVAGGAWINQAMNPGAGGTYSADIPGQGAGTAVEFYVEGVDALSATSRWPARVDARAMLEFEDNRSVADKNNIRIIMTSDEWAFMRDPVREMGNHRLGCTVIYNESEIIYDCRIRLKGSMWSRPNGGFNMRFPADHLFRGVHGKVRFDHARFQEILVKHMA
ncbi:MAG: lamin tail domain-containing protein, partial [Verrucomicrobiota bacterium]